MANATRKTIEKTVTEKVTILELTQDEADWLKGLVSFESSDEGQTIFKALGAPTETDIQVGDKVRILKANTSDSYNGRVGTVGRIDEHDPDVPYRVEFSDGDYEWAITVERAND